MDGLFDFLKSTATSSDVSGYIIAGAILIIGVLVAYGLTRFFAPIGEGTGHAIAKVGDSVEDIAAGVGAIGHGVGRTVGGPGALMESWGKAAEIRAENEKEEWKMKLEDGMGRTVYIEAHGPNTAPQMPQMMQQTPMLPAPSPEVVGLLAGPKKSKGKH